jgi:16S rRNA (cytosine967-C5)-methyltransferase
MAYCWYRCQRGFDQNMPFEDRLHAALYLCGTNLKVNNLVLPEPLRDTALMPRSERMNKLNQHYPPADKQEKLIPGIFHLEDLWSHDIPFSNGMDKYHWLQSMLIQPRMFIRVRKNKDGIIKCLQDNNIDYKISGNCISLPNSSPIDTLLNPEDYVVQDASSQQTGSYFSPEPNEHWWDCCSGAGGKSLLLKDAVPAVQLTVSDKRNTIIHNLKERFKLYGYPPPVAHILDTADKEQIQKALLYKHFDGIICDVPCSGSGTWARTPEQLYFFNPQQLAELSALQKEIAGNAAKRIAPGGKMIYITCSVFKAENEDIVNHVLKYKYSLQVTKQLLINGTANQADSMFVAVLEKKTTA